eukprot:TRINITY_DN15288_c0_g1_i1.p1 TRINITY_DN15288_c0_g1~~TRINITY_DN15288_c0_g1_i1.p1  ORF type:complete len:131 (+),score=10.91 TRINITY_DN15288_c0_g1_i1:791-1183(+)
MKVGTWINITEEERRLNLRHPSIGTIVEDTNLAIWHKSHHANQIGVINLPSKHMLLDVRVSAKQVHVFMVNHPVLRRPMHVVIFPDKTENSEMDLCAKALSNAGAASSPPENSNFEGHVLVLHTDVRVSV